MHTENNNDDKLFILSKDKANKLYICLKEMCHDAGFDTKINSEDFIKQIVFEFWYDNYTDKSQFTNIYAADKPTMYPHDDDPRYIHNKRAYNKKIITPKTEQKNYFENRYINDVNPLEKFPTQYTTDNNGKEIPAKHQFPEYANIQFEHLITNTYLQKNNIVWKLYTEKLNNKNYKNPQIIEDLKDFDEIYNDINNIDSSFKRCLQYYQLEINIRFETIYKICMMLKKNKKPITENDIQYAHSFHKITCPIGIFLNRFILGLDYYFNNHTIDDNGDIATSIVNELSMRLAILNSMKENIEIPDNYDITKIESAEEYFDNFLGQGQHIVRNKNINNDIRLSDLKKIYKSNSEI